MLSEEADTEELKIEMVWDTNVGSKLLIWLCPWSYVVDHLLEVNGNTKKSLVFCDLQIN